MTEPTEAEQAFAEKLRGAPVVAAPISFVNRGVNFSTGSTGVICITLGDGATPEDAHDFRHYMLSEDGALHLAIEILTAIHSTPLEVPHDPQLEATGG